MEKKGKQTGKGLKPAPNWVDTGSVVNTVTGGVRFGRQKMSGNDPKRNSMVSGNQGMKKRA